MPGRMNWRKFTKNYKEFFKGSREMYAPPYDHIVQVGDPVLRCKAKPVDVREIHTEKFKKLIIRLRSVLFKYGSEGLSAPQIGIDKRIFVMCLTSKMVAEYNNQKALKVEPIPFQVWINPEIKILDFNTETFQEGCASMHGYIAEVPRHRRILLTGLDEKGKENSLSATGWTARIIQHEMDHLNGKLYVDLMVPKTLQCSSWAQINKYSGKVFVTFAPTKWWESFLHPPVK
ncbi:peptide deformylase, mitochondrial-like isoform X2 [Lycorma delicatula]|uniref:peptide deformylase, mitochondrial-like isoform X2 n=1 Tax=Lycorma delicatula TaxID=130591 RepID=UPI003F51428A